MCKMCVRRCGGLHAQAGLTPMHAPSPLHPSLDARAGTQAKISLHLRIHPLSECLADLLSALCLH